MTTQSPSDPATALLALLAYQNLCVAETLGRGDDGEPELPVRVSNARLAADALARFTRMCDAIPGGQNAALGAMAAVASPVDEFNAVTVPRGRAEQSLRLLFVATLELEVVQRVQSGVSDDAGEAVSADAATWRAIDHGSAGVVQALAASSRALDELSNYARRLLGEGTVMGQRIIVREEGIRRALTGGPDVDLSASTAVLEEVLAAVSARLAQLGLSM